MENNNLLKLKTRRILYIFIKQNPGLHFRELCRRITINRGSLEYHLRYLIKHNLIYEKNEGKFTRYYANGSVGSRQREILNCLQHKILRRIIIYLLSVGSASNLELSKCLEKDISTISFHLKKLEEKEIIEQSSIVKEGVIGKKGYIVKRHRRKNEKLFSLKESVMIFDLLINYKDSFHDDNIVESIIEFRKIVLSNGGYPKIIPDFNTKVDNLIDVFYSIFPNPYYM